jgi:hypothetical protein
MRMYVVDVHSGRIDERRSYRHEAGALTVCADDVQLFAGESVQAITRRLFEIAVPIKLDRATCAEGAFSQRFHGVIIHGV